MNKVFEKIIEKLEERQKEYLVGFGIHDNNEIIGSEYIMQDDEAQVDALELVCNIFDSMEEAEQFGTDINVGSNGWI